MRTCLALLLIAFPILSQILLLSENFPDNFDFKVSYVNVRSRNRVSSVSSYGVPRDVENKRAIGRGRG